jgi:hypothetical protein
MMVVGLESQLCQRETSLGTRPSSPAIGRACGCRITVVGYSRGLNNAVADGRTEVLAARYRISRISHILPTLNVALVLLT